MKGTLFSADFIEDSNGDLRLLEVNTDTSTINLDVFDYSDFVLLLQNNNIFKVVVVHKPRLHQEMVDHLKSYLLQNATFIVDFSEVKEGPNVIYPTQVADEEGSFILRLAYDESSIFDSEYTKSKLNLLTLFYDGNEKDSVVQFYHSSLSNQYNSITDIDNVSNLQLNPYNLPDAVVKNTIENQQIAKFYKIGSEVENENEESRWNNFINLVSNDSTLVQKYHANINGLNGNEISSIRTFSIVYGSNLDLVHIAQYRKKPIFELPTVLDYNQSIYVNQLDNKHFYEFATNYVKYEGQFEGILNTHLIIKSDNSEVEAGSLSVGDELKSFYIGGSSLNEDQFYVDNWHISGSNLPTGSYMTSSVVIYKNTKLLDNKTLLKITVNNNEDSLYVSAAKSFLVHDSVKNIINWKTAVDVVENTDYLIDYDGSIAQVTSNELYITNDNEFSLIELDVEETDTYIIAGTTPINSFITHNAPCFVAGTNITLEDGLIKKIEEIKHGDVVSTFDFESKEIKQNIVNAVFSKMVNHVVEYELENGEVVKCTFDHPIYVLDKGWASYDSELSKKLYSLESTINQIEIGDKVQLYNGFSEVKKINVHFGEAIVYNLQDIEGNHNYFANNILVHNRACFVAGTKVTIENGLHKNIEDIEIDDVVLSFNEKTKKQEPNKVLKILKPVHEDLVEYTLSNGNKIISTFDHPFYVNGLILASYKPELTSKRYDYLNNVVEIKLGDLLNTDNGDVVKIESIFEMESIPTQTYIINVENNNNFYANSVLVHNK